MGNSILTKTINAPGVIIPGRPVTYTITVRNRTLRTCFLVSLTDRVSPARLVSWTQIAGPPFVLTQQQTGDVVSVSAVGRLPPGQQASFELTVVFTSATQRSFSNAVQAQGVQCPPTETESHGGGSALSIPEVIDGQIVPPLVLASASVEAAVTELPAHLRLQLGGPAVVRPGKRAKYDLQLTNGGPGAASDVVLKELLPEGAVIKSWKQLSGPAFAIGGDEARIALLPADATARFRITLLINDQARGVFTNRVQVSASQHTEATASVTSKVVCRPK